MDKYSGNLAPDDSKTVAENKKNVKNLIKEGKKIHKSNPTKAKEIYKEVYVKYHSLRKQTTVSKVVDILQREKVKRDKELSDKYEEMIQFTREHGVVSFDNKGGNVVFQKLLTLSEALTESQLMTIHAKADYEVVKAIADDPEKVKQAFELMKKAKPKVIFLNLFGGITKCDTVAKGVKSVIEKEGIDCPVVARIKGMNEDIAKDILKDAGLITATTLEDAAKRCSDLAGGK